MRNETIWSNSQISSFCILVTVEFSIDYWFLINTMVIKMIKGKSRYELMIDYDCYFEEVSLFSRWMCETLGNGFLINHVTPSNCEFSSLWRDLFNVPTKKIY